MNSSSVFNFNSRAQGTIEYLVIIAIVVVISLVVVAMMMGIFENSGDVVNTAETISTQTLPVALNEAILGVGTDANGLIVLTNNTGNLIRDIRIEIDGKDHNYFDTQISTGSSKTFRLNTLEIPCEEGETSVTKTITIIYTTRDGLIKTQKIENIKVTCATTDNPTPTKTPTEEKQNEEEPETPEPTPTDIIDPELDDLSGAVEENTITLTFRAWDNNKIQLFEIKENDGEYEEITPTYLGTDYEDGNYYSIVKEDLEYETEYTYYIRVTDYNNNIVTDSTSNITEAEPYVELCEGQTELYGECYDNIVAYWPMDETTGTTAIDYADFDNNATCTNCPTINQTGKVGRAYYFDGTNDALTAGQTGIPFGTSNRTFCSWIKIDDDAISQERGIVGYGTSSSGQWSYMGLYSKYLRYSGANNDYWTTSLLNPSEWTFVCITYNNSPQGLKFYINGVFDKNQTSLTLNTATSNVNIGYVDLGQRYWKGYLDEVMIFNENLSQSDINEIYYNSGGNLVGQLRAGLVGYWPLNETSGTTSIDYAGFDNNGTITGSPSIGQIGKVGNAYSFDGTGSQYVSIGMTGFPTGSSSRTSCAWINTTSGGSNTNGSRSIFGYGENCCNTSDKKAYSMWHYLSRSNKLAGGFAWYDPTSSNSYTGWTHFCITYENSNQTVKIYGDGSLDGTTSTYALNTTNNGTAYIGKLPYDTYNASYGLIDEVTIWNRVLSATEILNLYNLNSSGTGLN